MKYFYLSRTTAGKAKEAGHTTRQSPSDQTWELIITNSETGEQNGHTNVVSETPTA